MTTLIDYALMAGASYISNRAEINRFPAPDVWLENIQMRTTKDSKRRVGMHHLPTRAIK